MTLAPRPLLLLCSALLGAHPRTRWSEAEWASLLDPLPEPLQVTIILRVLHEKTEQEIADFLGIANRQTIHARIHRACELLRPHVERALLCHDDPTVS